MGQLGRAFNASAGCVQLYHLPIAHVACCLHIRPAAAPHPKHAKESACGCAGLFSAPVALPLYAHAFEQAGALQHLEAFASFNGPDFYGLPRNTGGWWVHCRAGVLCWHAGMPVAAWRQCAGCARMPTSCLLLFYCTRIPLAYASPRSLSPLCPTDKVILRRQPWTVPASYAFGDSEVVPMWAGLECPWTVVEQ